MMIDPDWSSTILSKVEIKEDLPAPVLPTIPTWAEEKFFRDLGFFGVILVNKSLKALCLGSKMRYDGCIV